MAKAKSAPERRDPPRNPLAEKLLSRQAHALDVLNGIVWEQFSIDEPFGLRFGEEVRTATNQEAATARLQCFGDDLTLDLRKDIGEQAVTKLRAFARDVLAIARRVEKAVERGEFSKSVKGAYVAIDGNIVKGPVDDHTALVMSRAAEGEHVRRLSDGTEYVVNHE